MFCVSASVAMVVDCLRDSCCWAACADERVFVVRVVDARSDWRDDCVEASVRSWLEVVS